MSQTLVGLFDDITDAQTAQQALVNSGLPPTDVTLDVTQPSAGDVGTGRSGRGVLDRLTGGGIHDAHAHLYAEGVRRGGALLTVTVPDGQTSSVTDILNRHNAVNIEERGQHYQQTGFTAYDENAAPYNADQIAQERQRVQLHAEQLQANKTQVQAGEVAIHKNVVTETRSLDVPVTHEEVVVERHAVNQPVGVGEADFRDQTINVPVSAEQVTVNKTAVVTEEISVGKRQVQETQHVTDTVRHEEARLENPQNVDVVDRDNTTTNTTR